MDALILHLFVCIVYIVSKQLPTSEPASRVLKSFARNLPLEFLQLFGVEITIPSDIDENFDASIELHQRLRSRRARLSPEQRGKLKHSILIVIVLGKKVKEARRIEASQIA